MPLISAAIEAVLGIMGAAVEFEAPLVNIRLPPVSATVEPVLVMTGAADGTPPAASGWPADGVRLTIQSQLLGIKTRSWWKVAPLFSAPSRA